MTNGWPAAAVIKKKQQKKHNIGNALIQFSRCNRFQRVTAYTAGDWLFNENTDDAVQ